MNSIKQRKVAYDCLYYLGDRPCKWHKEEGVICECRYYKAVEGSLAIIKLDAIGDVLRTTCLLDPIRERWPDWRIVWITRPESVPLLENNPYVDVIVPYGPDALSYILANEFSAVINLDAGKISSSLAALSVSREKIGFVMNKRGVVEATNEAAEGWLRLGIFDDLKKTNKLTYQEWMCRILDLPKENLKYVLELTEKEKTIAQEKLNNMGLEPGDKILGIHTGAGGRWPQKIWGEDKFIQFIKKLVEEYGDNLKVLLFGGPLEREMNQRILNGINGPVYDAGCENTIRQFAALTMRCTVMLSGDSLAMHIGLATGRRVIVLFGPTSHPEIELFGLGEKIYPDMDCLCCYKNNCERSPNCMDMITVEQVLAAVKRQLREAGGA
jgi:ADP-heptose:LPS heptosyltransferase